jgi:FkbM family methyltransferase
MQKTRLFTQQTLFVDDSDSLGLIANGIFEPEETKSIMGLVKPGDRFLDIGANVGYYTVLVAELVEPAGRVFAVEPNEKNFEILVANTLSWQEEGRVEVFQTALSDETGSANLFLNSRNCGMHRLYSSVVCTHESVPVTVVRGDELQLEPLDFIKIDIEGYEPRAMRGLKQTLLNSPHVKILSEFSPFSMMEANESPLRWLDWMSKLGFVPLSLDQGKWSSSACSGLIDSVKKLDQVNFSALIRSLDGLDNVTILDRVIQAGKSAGYNRPIVENIFFVRHSEIALIENLILN